MFTDLAFSELCDVLLNSHHKLQVCYNRWFVLGGFRERLLENKQPRIKIALSAECFREMHFVYYYNIRQYFSSFSNADRRHYILCWDSQHTRYTGKSQLACNIDHWSPNVFFRGPHMLVRNSSRSGHLT